MTKTFNEATKRQYVQSMEQHAAADEIVQGQYWENGKGCHVGCLVQDKERAKGSWHKQLEIETGIPEAVAYLMDRIFEGLPPAEAKEFARTTITLVPANTDLSLVVPGFMAWLMNDLKKYTEPRTDQRKALRTVEKLYKRWIDGDKPTDSEFEAAEDAAWDAWAARDAAWAAWATWAAAARDAAEAAARAAEAAAWAAAWAAAYQRMANKLQSLLVEAGK